MCDVIKLCLKRRIATRSGKGNQPLNIKTAEERPILKLGLPYFWWSFYFLLLLVASFLFRRINMTSNMTLSRASKDRYRVRDFKKSAHKCQWQWQQHCDLMIQLWQVLPRRITNSKDEDGGGERLAVVKK